MSTYADDPYVFAHLDAPPSNSCSDVDIFVQKLRNTFFEGGWDIEDIGPRLILTTEDSPGFSFCTLGHDDVSFYTVTLGSGSTAIVDEPDDCDACDNVTVDLVVQTYDNQSQRHEFIKGIIASLYQSVEGITAYPLPSETDGTDLVSEIVINATSNCVTAPTVGSQLISNIDFAKGAGFIARSQDSIESGNRVELYCTYQGTGGATSFVRLYYRVGGWPSRVVTPGAETSISIYCPNPSTMLYTPATATGVHPLTIVDDELGTTVQQADVALNGQDIEVWVNSYTAIWDPAPARVGNSAGALCAALKLKALEGESEASLNITRAIIFVARVGGGSSLREEMRLQSTRLCLEFRGNGFSNVEHLGNTTHGVWGPLIMCGKAETIDYEDHTNGIIWLGGIAEVGEPWVACNFLNPGTSELAPIIGQLWDCIIPARSINLGFETQDTQRPFPWDSQLWRYYQTNKEGISNVGPPSSMAFRVADLRVFDGDDYTGEVPATLTNLEIDVNPIPAGGSAIITVTIEPAPSDGAFVTLQTKGDERMQFPDFVVTFSSGQTTQNVNVTTIDLEIEESVTLTAKGTNTLSLSVTYSAT